ncbi:ATP-dependent Clp protease ATP-binding subunit CLPT1, chloroplastic [Ziziphus jujuba]|uniref:ATP-dependent Clp protease ATP-binding subunit CLPT1, chloroplastic n=1 Tax=Ziziphus jujuba TaxID=326968 RepID=A0A6P3ZR49_ZIZJJ|nr:ATP-dependent Clp protease ATP-binding subunit CLPT1, chloroplastic [Ziziphus jujuba]
MGWAITSSEVAHFKKIGPGAGGFGLVYLVSLLLKHWLLQRERETSSATCPVLSIFNKKLEDPPTEPLGFLWATNMASHTLSALPITSSISQTSHGNCGASSAILPWRLNLHNLSSSFVGCKLKIGPSSSSHLASKHRPAVATVLFSLPTAKPEKDSSAKITKWSARAIKSFAMAELEARKLKYPNTGTEALLMGILVEGTSIAAKFLRANGITLFKVREETVNLLGKSDMYFFSPEHPPLTEPAQRALDWAVDQKLKSGEDGEVTTTHLLLGIWSEVESAGHKILESLGFDDEKAKELGKSMDKDYVFNFK